jgi:WD40 repeat protein
VLFSPDGQTIAAMTVDGALRLWDWRGDTLTALIEPDSPVDRVAFSSDGQTIVTILQDDTVRFWDIQGSNVVDSGGTTVGGRIARFKDDGQTIEIHYHDGSVSLWDLRGNKLAEYSDPDVEFGTFSPDGQSILTTAADDTMHLRNLEGERLAQLPEVFRDSGFSPDGKTVLVVSRSNNVPLYSARGQQIALLEGHSDQVLGTRFREDGEYILTVSGDFAGGQVTGSADYTARLWRHYAGELAVFSSSIAEYRFAELSPDGQMILTSGRGQVQLWDMQGNQLATFDGYAVSFSPDGQTILTVASDDTMRLWDLQGNELATIGTVPPLTTPGSFSTDGEKILSLMFETVVPSLPKSWYTDGTEVPLPIGLEPDIFYYSKYSHDGRFLVTTLHDGSVHLWDLNQQENDPVVLNGHSFPVDIVEFSPDGQSVLTALTDGFNSEDFTARLWDLQGNELALFEGHTDRLNHAVFHPNGEIIATTSRDGTARLWNLQGNQLAILEHANQVGTVVFSPDGQMVLTTSSDIAKLWDIQGNELATLAGHTDFVMNSQFHPDGDRIFTTSLDGTARVWLVNREDLLALASCRVSRDLTDEEVQRFGISERSFILEERQCPPVFSWEQ